MIIGIDEVGRGCWAGPLVVAAVGLGGADIKGLTDSKKLTAKQREAFALQIRHHAPEIGIGWISNRLIDRNGLSWGLKQAARLAVSQISCDFSEIIIDGNFKFLDDPRATTLKKADLLVPSVSAASIIAKVARDRYMYRMHAAFPDYGFLTHVGYGTTGHQAAIRKFGITPLHRLSYAPLESYTPLPAPEEPSLPSLAPIESTAGRQAEKLAAAFLEQEGYEILGQNWRTKWCEIDVIARKGDVVHFVEVKYRQSSMSGDGLAAITPRKISQMRFAAELWSHKQHYAGASVLSALTLTGDPAHIATWLPDIS